MAAPGYHQLDETTLLSVIAERMEHLHGDVGEMKSAIKDLASAITKLALIEERQGQTSIEIARVCKIIDKLEERVVVLEAAAPLQKQTSLWVMTGVWGAAGVLALLILKALGVLG